LFLSFIIVNTQSFGLLLVSYNKFNDNT